MEGTAPTKQKESTVANARVVGFDKDVKLVSYSWCYGSFRSAFFTFFSVIREIKLHFLTANGKRQNAADSVYIF